MSSVEVIEVEPVEASWPIPMPRNQNAGVKVNQLVLPQAIRLYQFTAFSSNAAAQYILLFDANALPADGAVPAMAFTIALTNYIQPSFGGRGRVCPSGLVLCTSSTSVTKTLNATADTLLDVQYDRLD